MGSEMSSRKKSEVSSVCGEIDVKACASDAMSSPTSSMPAGLL